MDPKVQRRRWELKLGLDLLRSITAKGVIMPLSSQLGFRGFKICSSKIALGWRFAESGVFLRFLNTSFCADLSSSLCQWASKSFCFRISLTLAFIASWASSDGFSFRSFKSLMVSVRVEFVVVM